MIRFVNVKVYKHFILLRSHSHAW